MTMAETLLDVSSVFETGGIDLEQVRDLESYLYSSERARHELEAAVDEVAERAGDAKEDDRDLTLKVAIAMQLLGRHEEAVAWFGPAREGKEKRYHAAQSLAATGQFDQALTELDRAEARGWDKMEVDLFRATVSGKAGDFKTAQSALDRWADQAADDPDWHYHCGELLERRGELEDAFEAYDRAVELQPDHPEANFRLGFLSDLHGEEETAKEYYVACLGTGAVHVNALLNLAVIHEDRGRYEEARKCLRRVLASFPNHPRARLYSKDVESSKTMYYDEDQERRLDRRNQILETPITDFELSVRARHCLTKMNIATLGDLLRISEPELLAYKNFGETSLNEIKTMLTQKGLRLGQAAEQPPAEPEEEEEPAGDQLLLRKPAAELELSVRARKCLQRLDIQTVGDLTSRTESELLGVKNFGLTSLNEIKQRLTEEGLCLRKPDR